MAAQSAMGRQRHDDALELLDQVLERDATMIDPHQMRGQILLERQEHEAAIASFKTALELSPEHRASLFGLAHASQPQAVAPLAVIPYLANETDTSKDKTRKRVLLVSVVTGITVILLLIHFLVSPLDVLWFRGMRKVDTIIGE